VEETGEGEGKKEEGNEKNRKGKNRREGKEREERTDHPLSRCNVSRSDYCGRANPSRHPELRVTSPGLRIGFSDLEMTWLLKFFTSLVPPLQKCMKICYFSVNFKKNVWEHSSQTPILGKGYGAFNASALCTSASRSRPSVPPLSHPDIQSINQSISQFSLQALGP